MSDRYDLVAVGGGTAGLVAARAVAGIGGRAALIEAGRCGGDCLWTGCVPSKALLATAKVAHNMRTAERFGLRSIEPDIDLGRILTTIRRAQDLIEPEDSPRMLRTHGIEVIEGRARFLAPGTIGVGDHALTYRTALIATGSRPVVPPLDGLSQVAPLTTDTIWELDTLPARFVVLGGGAVGCELGQAFSRLGSTVTIVEAAPTLLPEAEAEVGDLLADRFRREGIDVRTGTSGTCVTDTPAGGRLHLDDGSTVDFDRILVAVGRQPNTADLGLDRVGVELDDRGHVIVDDTLRSTGDHIYAAGDVTGAMPFTHVAAHHARLVVTNALFRTRRSPDYDRIPWAVFTDPEIARVGLDAARARQRWGADAIVQRFDHAHLDRAITHGQSRGWAELIGDPKGHLVGATIIGEAAGESIAELVAWIATGRRIDDLSTTVHAYPTFTEGPSRAADDVQRARLFHPRVTRITKPLLSILRHLDAPDR